MGTQTFRVVLNFVGELQAEPSLQLFQECQYFLPEMRERSNTEMDFGDGQVLKMIVKQKVIPPLKIVDYA